MIAANGLLYIGPWTCDCNLTIMGTVAMCSAHDCEPEAEGRFEPGPGGMANVAHLEISPNDWPVYRGTMRTAGAPAWESRVNSGDSGRIARNMPSTRPP